MGDPNESSGMPPLESTNDVHQLGQLLGMQQACFQAIQAGEKPDPGLVHAALHSVGVLGTQTVDLTGGAASPGQWVGCNQACLGDLGSLCAPQVPQHTGSSSSSPARPGAVSC